MYFKLSSSKLRTKHCRMRDKSSMFSSAAPYLKTWFFYVVFNAELNGTIIILCFCRAIIDLQWPSRAQLGHSRSIIARRKHKIMMMPFNSALKTSTYKNQVFKYSGRTKTLSFCPSSYSVKRLSQFLENGGWIAAHWVSANFLSRNPWLFGSKSRYEMRFSHKLCKWNP